MILYPQEHLVLALKKMAAKNDVIKDTHGNLSYCDPHTGMIWIKPSGVPYEDVTVEMVSGIAICDGMKEVGLGFKPSVDLPHHLSIYRRHSWVRSICHTHSPYATVFAMLLKDIPCLSTEQADYFGGDIRCLPYRDLDLWGDFVELSQNEKAVLLGSHGVLTFGDTTQKAVDLAVALENVAQKTYLALQLGGPPVRRGFDKEEIRKWHERYQNKYGQ